MQASHSIYQLISPRRAALGVRRCGRPGLNDGAKRAGGFTRLDLVVCVAGLVVLAGLLGFQLTGERGRTAQCARNLAVLGEGMQGFAADHNGGLPPAAVAVGSLEVSWSFLIAPYVRPALAKVNSSIAKWEYEPGIADRLLCPSDRLLRGFPRSYAMSAHDMNPENWPLNPENWPLSGTENCGVGLVWDGNALKRLLKKEVPPGGTVTLAELPLIKLAQLPDPANTLLLTELVRAGNKLKSVDMAVVSEPGEQVEEVTKQGGNFHNGRFNYLMVDGHVEQLRPCLLETFSASVGIWSIKKGD